jgi:hypothetical protein
MTPTLDEGWDARLQKNSRQEFTHHSVRGLPVYQKRKIPIFKPTLALVQDFNLSYPLVFLLHALTKV